MFFPEDELTADELRYLLHYNPLTGIWTWINPPYRGRVGRGDIAGTLDDIGRRKIKIRGTRFISARLAYLYMTGEWPEEEVDHINRVKDDDRWCNLRPATRSQNAFNIARNEGRGEWRGIQLRCNKYAVNIGSIYLGCFHTFEIAKDIRDQALKEWAGPFATSPYSEQRT